MVSPSHRHGVRKLKSVGPAVGPELAIMEAWPSDKRVGKQLGIEVSFLQTM